jgi:hypothetical protein
MRVKLKIHEVNMKLWMVNVVMFQTEFFSIEKSF